MANAIITTVDGKPVYLRDIADVRRGYKDREAITRVDGKESIELAVYKEGDANTVQLSKAVQERFEEIRKNLPAATDIKTVLRPGALHSPRRSMRSSKPPWRAD